MFRAIVAFCFLAFQTYGVSKVSVAQEDTVGPDIEGRAKVFLLRRSR
jgi:hypothetical protein